jgi:hypothetical protein
MYGMGSKAKAGKRSTPEKKRKDGRIRCGKDRSVLVLWRGEI